MARSLRLALLTAGLLLALGAPAFAQSASTSLGVNATVVNNCTISTAAVAFGSYDPIVAHDTTPLDATGTITVRCTKGAGSRIDLDLGANPSGNTQRMATGTEFLTYELYQDAARTTVWGSGPTGGLTIAPAPNKSPRTFTVYGRVPAGQDVSAGPYTDTVTATILF